MELPQLRVAYGCKVHLYSALVLNFKAQNALNILTMQGQQDGIMKPHINIYIALYVPQPYNPQTISRRLQSKREIYA